MSRTEHIWLVGEPEAGSCHQSIRALRRAGLYEAGINQCCAAFAVFSDTARHRHGRRAAAAKESRAPSWRSGAPAEHPLHTAGRGDVALQVARECRNLASPALQATLSGAIFHTAIPIANAMRYVGAAIADADIHYSHDGGLIFPYVYQDKPTVISLRSILFACRALFYFRATSGSCHQSIRAEKPPWRSSRRKGMHDPQRFRLGITYTEPKASHPSRGGRASRHALSSSAGDLKGDL